VIDLHCHLLPGIDDGPESLDGALAMARLAVANGIRTACVTPHLQVGRWENDIATIEPVVATYRAALAATDIPLEIVFAAEVRLAYEIVPLVQAGRVPFIGELDGYRVMLLEMPHSHVPVGAEKLVQWLIGQKIRPMIAHPERNKDVMRDPRKLMPLLAEGCLVQLTADAVAGEFGEEAARRSHEFLEQHWVTVLASDAHDTNSRPPRLLAGMEVAARIVGDAEARRLVEDMPRRLLRGS